MPAFRHWVATRAALIVFAATAVGGSVFAWVLGASAGQALPIAVAMIGVGCLALFAGVATGWLVEGQVGRRARLLSSFLSRAGDDSLRRLPPLGNDELGHAAESVNRLLADMTVVRGSMIDQQRELETTQDQLRLKAALAEKSGELEARLRERAILFDILRASASKIGLEAVLSTLAERLSSALRLREVAILILENQRFVIRGALGFPRLEAVLGRSIAPGEGVAGDVANSRDPVIVPDVKVEPRYLAFWGEAPREGSFAAVPIRHGEQLLGILAMTRPQDDPLSENETRFLGAVADQMAMSVRHAQLVEELRELSMHDELTKLANRRFLGNRLELEMQRARRFSTALGVLAIDIDHFKRINDRLGHASGDEALRRVADILQTSVRSVDMVARVGGEEFVVLLPRTDIVEASAVAEKLRKRVESTQFEAAGGEPAAQLTISAGVAVLRPKDSVEDLLARADQALYLAKHRGRNRIAVHADDRVTPESALH